MKIIDIEGVGETYAARLQAAGIQTTEDLLAAGGSRAHRRALAERTAITEKLLLEWINHADLMRIRGVGAEYADLLEETGVDTVIELSHRNPDNLALAMRTVNEQKEVVRRVPGVTEVEDWVAEAKTLGRTIEY